MKKIITTILSIAIGLMMTSPTTFALSAVEELQQRGSCYSETLINELEAISTGTKIVTELEEELVKSADIGAAKIVTCYRVTACKKNDKSKSICTSFLNNECKLEDKQQKIKTGNKEEVDATKTNCKKIQVIVSEAGTGLFYAYIGMIYKWLASVIGIVAVLIIVFSGIQISAAGGDPSVIDDARGRIVRALLGMAVLFFASVILYTINPTFFVK